MVIRRAIAIALLGLAAAGVFTAGVSGSPTLDVTITSGPSGPGSETSATFTFEVNEAASLRCALDGAALSSCRSPQSYSGLAAGAHTFRVQAENRDGAGNLYRDEDTRSFSVGATPPPPTLLPIGDPLPPPARSDLDNDGVRAARDVCPGTPRKTRALWRGCAAIDLMRESDRLAQPLLSDLADARGLLGQGLRGSRKQTSRAGKLLAGAATALELGRPCPAATKYRRAVAQLKHARLDLRSVFRRRSKRVAGRAKGDDVSPGQLGVAALDLKRSLADGALARVRKAGPAFTSPCKSKARRFKLRRKVVSTDDAARIVQLAGGPRLLLARRARLRGSITEDSAVRVAGLRFKDGSGVATGATGSFEQQGKQPGIVPPSKCLALRVAPIQPFPPFAQPGKITLHDPVAYRGGYGIHVLERGMRLGVEKVGCANKHSNGKTWRYSARILERPANRATTDVLASGLREGDTPVGFGTVVQVGGSGSFELITFRQACAQLGRNPCDPPVELDTQKLTFAFRERASQATAKYSDRSFGTKDNDLTGDHESAKVVGLKLKGLATAASGFRASAYVLEEGQETRPQTRLIGLDQPFLIYADDISDQNLYPVLAYGTITPSGLAWPRVEGIRNGKEFSYSAALPRIVRDRTLHGSCFPVPAYTLAPGPPNPNSNDPAAPNFPPQKPFPVPLVQDSYYELPFSKDFGPIGSGGLNIDDPEVKGRHGDSQPWALDLNAPYGTPVLAARGGVVVNLFDTDKYNDSPSYDDPENNDNRPASNTKIGNYIWVRQEDGSFAVYFHHRRKTAYVKVGDTVRRGKVLARTGSTGLATGPHVHFEPFSYTGVINVGETNPGGTGATNIRARYGAAVVPDVIPFPTLGAAEFDPCYIPRKGDSYYSTNSFPKGD